MERLSHSYVIAPRLATSVVFVDWHGVLSHDVFWSSIIREPGHWAHRRLARDVECLFADRAQEVQSWMRGNTSSSEVVERLPPLADRRCNPDYLLRRLRDDCSRMNLNRSVLQLLRRLPPLTLVVVATDNMDCFADQACRIAELNRHVHGLRCSSDLGLLKAEDPAAFFGPIVRDHGLSPHDALLLDDSAGNCAAFEQWGGRAVTYTGSDSELVTVARWASARDSADSVFAPATPEAA